MNSTDNLRREIARGLRDAKTRPPRSITEFVTSDITIPDGKAKGFRYNWARQPVMRLWFEAIDSGIWNEFVFTAPSQFGKTLAGFVAPLVYHTCEIQENYVLGLPYADMAANKWEADIAPLLRSSPSLRRQMPKHGSGSSGGRPRDSITLACGSIIKLASAGAGDEGKAAFTSRVVGVTEAKRFSKIGESSSEADPLRQLRARQRSFEEDERVTYIEGTVGQSDQLPWTLKAQSSDSRILSPCPHCRKWISPERDHLMGWQEAKDVREAKLAFFACPECGEEITDAERAESLTEAKLVHAGQTIDKKGRVKGDPPASRRLWFRASAWHNLFLKAGDLGADEWRAAQIREESPERLSADRELCQFVWSIPWDPPAIDTDLVLDREQIDGRRLATPRRMVPEPPRSLCVGVDLGSKEGWYLVLLRYLDRWHVLDYDLFEICSHAMPVDQAIIQALGDLREMLMAGYADADGKIWTPNQIWYDAGYQAPAVNAFVRKHAKMSLKAIDVVAYGRGASTFDKYTAPKRKTHRVRQIDPHGQWFVESDGIARSVKCFWDVDSSKYQVLQALTIPQDQPGAITLYSGTSKTHERLVRHLTNEPIVTVKTPLGGEKQKFHRNGANHLLDCMAAAWRASMRYEWLGETTAAKAAASTTPNQGKWYADSGESEASGRREPAQEKPTERKGWYAN